MLLKTTLFLVSLLSLFQAWHKSTLASVFAKPVLGIEEYRSFSEESKSIVLWMGLLLLFTCLLFSKKTDDQPVNLSSFNWLGSFLLIIGLSASVVLAANPAGRFPWNQRSSYISISAHSIKPNLFKKLSSTPDLIIFGSSISFTTPASYFAKKWGLTAFNMSLNSGGPIDFFKMLNYLIKESPDEKTPSILLVELVSPGLKISNPMQTPLLLLPDLPMDQAVLAFGTTADDLVQISSLSDTIFTFLFVDAHRWQIRTTFTKDGSGITINKTKKALIEYQDSVKNDISQGKDLISCKNNQLDLSGKEYMEKLVELSQTHRISIIFYRPPINTDLYTVSKTKPNMYAACKNMFNAYMRTLTRQNTNIFYRDLSDNTKISMLGRKVYFDTHHLNAYGNRLVAQALNKEIKSALAWARINHK